MRLVWTLLLSVALLVLIPVGQWDPQEGREWAYAFGNGFLFVAMIIPGLVIHELGHALAARLLRLDVHEIHIGVGKNLVRWRLGETEVWLNAIPIGGLVGLSSPRRGWIRLRVWLAVLAGPLANGAAMLAVVAVGLALDAELPGSKLDGIQPLDGFFLANLYLGALNLVPIFSDGNTLLTLPFRRGAADELAASRYVWRSQRMRREGRFDAALAELLDGAAKVPGTLAIANSLGLVLLDKKDFRAARAAFLDQLARPDLKKAQRAILQNNVAWTDLALDDPALLGEADELSATAYKGFKVAAFTGTRGAVLIATGNPREGLPLVRRALALNSDPRARGNNAVWIAIGEARLGNAAEARRYLAIARELDHDNDFLGRADAEIGAIVAA